MRERFYYVSNLNSSPNERTLNEGQIYATLYMKALIRHYESNGVLWDAPIERISLSDKIDLINLSEGQR